MKFLIFLMSFIFSFSAYAGNSGPILNCEIPGDAGRYIIDTTKLTMYKLDIDGMVHSVAIQKFQDVRPSSGTNDFEIRVAGMPEMFLANNGEIEGRTWDITNENGHNAGCLGL